MDEELYQAFITESEESITQLNNSLLSLESNPEDTDAIDDIFRQAHTLKGNFGAMGFDNAATVAHAVEDLLDEIRHDRLDVTPERMDLVFDGMDLIVDILHDIEANGESTIDPTDTVEEIRAAAETGGDAGNSNPAAPDEDDREDVDFVSLAAECVDTDAIDAATLAHAHVDLDVGQMKSVDAGIFLSNIPDVVDVVGYAPSRDAIEAGEFDDGFDLFVANLAPKAVESRLGDLWKVDSVETTDVSDVLDGVMSAGTSQEAPDSSDAEAAPSESDDDVDVEPEADVDEPAEATPADTDGIDDGPATDDGHPTSDEMVDDGGDGDGSDTDAGDTDASDDADSDDADSEDTSNDTDESNDEDDDSEDEGDASDDEDDDSEEARSISAVKSVRVDVDQLDELHELVEQLVTSRIKLRNAIDEEQNTALDTLDELDKISSNLQNTVMDMRLIPLKKVFDKFPRLVRDLAREQDKRVSFKVEGADIELDRTILDEISDPLMHVL
ncbi:Hpt domain-containing protein, partial [Haloferax profundi]|uniref:Hpt domain-containing protein n=1 Tax=Haloferax profundi TaxID=1544718 RepID=UPI0018D212F2